MIYISTSCVKGSRIKESVKRLFDRGFKNIELSGGTNYYNEIESDLLSLLKEDINFICHNYFPPPKKHFVVNLASMNDEVYYNSIEHVKRNIDLSKKLGSGRTGIHAGFFVDPKVDELGHRIENKIEHSKDCYIERFCEAYNILKKYAGNNFDIYIENNVFSERNYKYYNGVNPFMLCSSSDYFELSRIIDFKLLLDVGHLKVSSNILNNNFGKELEVLYEETDYIHLSDNNAEEDQNLVIAFDSELYKLLRKLNNDNKIFTLEIYDSLNNIEKVYNMLSELID